MTDPEGTVIGVLALSRIQRARYWEGVVHSRLGHGEGELAAAASQTRLRPGVPTELMANDAEGKAPAQLRMGQLGNLSGPAQGPGAPAQKKWV